MKFFLFLICTFPLFSNPILHTYLTFAGDANGSMTLNVHSKSKEPVQVTLFQNEVAILETTSEGEPFLEQISTRYLHYITFQDLEPEKLYKAVVNSKEILFRTLPKESVGLKIVIGGDWEKLEGSENMARLIAEQNPHLLLLGGDYPRWVRSLADYKDWDDWLDMVEKNLITKEGCLIPMILAIGNHDVFGEYDQPYENAPFFNAYFKQTEEKSHYFVKMLGDDLALFVLDSGHTAPHSGEQAKWLEENLRAYNSCKIKVALYHVPLYPSFRFGEQNGLFLAFYYALNRTKYEWKLGKIYAKEIAEGKEHWAPLFDTYHLTSAFEHHEHSLKRTKLLYNGQISPSGTLYLGDGGINPFYYITPIQGYKNYFAKTIGHLSFFWLMEVKKDKIDYTAIASHGKKIDHYTQLLKD
jgi:hypothetical protein